MHAPSLVFAVLAAAAVSRAQVGTDEAYHDPSLPPKGAIGGGPRVAPVAPVAPGTTSTLVGGSDQCSTPELIFGTGAFLFDNTIAIFFDNSNRNRFVHNLIQDTGCGVLLFASCAVN